MSESRFLSGKRLSLFAIFVSRPAETGYRTVRLHRTAVPFSDSEQRHKASRLKISATGQKTKPSGHMRFATARPYLKRDLLAAFLFHSSYNNADRPPRTGKRPADRKRARTEAAEQAPCPIVSDKTGLPNVNEDNPTGPRIPYASRTEAIGHSVGNFPSVSDGSANPFYDGTMGPKTTFRQRGPRPGYARQSEHARQEHRREPTRTNRKPYRPTTRITYCRAIRETPSYERSRATGGESRHRPVSATQTENRTENIPRSTRRDKPKHGLPAESYGGQARTRSAAAYPERTARHRTHGRDRMRQDLSSKRRARSLALTGKGGSPRPSGSDREPAAMLRHSFRQYTDARLSDSRTEAGRQRTVSGQTARQQAMSLRKGTGHRRE